jgi:hypothetical protein
MENRLIIGGHSVEFTLVDIAASIPLILPLFRRYKHRTPPNRYELQVSNIPKVPPKQKSAAGTSTTIVGNNNDLEAAMHNESEENILGREQTREVEGKQIVKETSYVVRFDRLRVSDGEEGEVWFDKRLLTMPVSKTLSCLASLSKQCWSSPLVFLLSCFLLSEDDVILIRCSGRLTCVDLGSLGNHVPNQ